MINKLKIGKNEKIEKNNFHQIKKITTFILFYIKYLLNETLTYLLVFYVFTVYRLRSNAERNFPRNGIIRLTARCSHAKSSR